MRRTALKRRSPMRRSRMVRGKKRTKYALRDRDMERMGWVKTLPCLLASGLPPFAELWRGCDPGHCGGAVEAHHAGVRALSRKAPDDTVIPLCDHHHDALTDRRLCFSGWPRGALKLWELAAVAWCQQIYAGREEAADALF